jgi:hypothetical protein
MSPALLIRYVAQLIVKILIAPISSSLMETFKTILVTLPSTIISKRCCVSSTDKFSYTKSYHRHVTLKEEENKNLCKILHQGKNFVRLSIKEDFKYSSPSEIGIVKSMICKLGKEKETFMYVQPTHQAYIDLV